MATPPQIRTPLIAGNWKMHGRLTMARELASTVAQGAPAGIDVLLCPPFPYLAPVAVTLQGSHVHLGAQNLATEAEGAYTGEVSGDMLADLQCGFVLVGHSERRTLYGETDDVVAVKFQRAQAAGLTPVLCIGETLAEREAGDTEAVIARQLDAVLAQAGVGALKQAVLAYEPVWAIGTGLTATPAQAQAVHRFIRARIEARDGQIAAGLRILYGGSVKADNAASLLAETDIDGGLIGGASLDADSFLAICQAATAQ
ncbi:Triose-phosphate isomerase [Alcanivorax sp. S71-1-4]|uniref:triose-phosphate isomerase n=1 Tax=Alcanivorax sp. S71-1-4 TaxID=1177159 RepID=UPI0016B4A412|nr:triose-phosphate isomerase [Alcanivorax sp. S71-1-4]KAF0810032.1 Triose-phosphate isomerase [Alcanivorax sp. S71-1-4]